MNEDQTNPIPRDAETHPEEIVLVRHGTSGVNVVPHVGRFLASTPAVVQVGGKPDHLVPITVEARDQARILGEILHRLYSGFDICFDSGYKRSVDTLDAILETFPSSERNPTKRRSHLDLRERDFGYTFNMSVTEVNQWFPWYAEYEATYGKFYSRPPGGESLADVSSRVHMFYNSLRRFRGGQRVLIVSHGRVMLAFQYWLEKIAVEEAVERMKIRPIDNLDVIRYRLKPNFDENHRLRYNRSDFPAVYVRMLSLAKEYLQNGREHDYTHTLDLIPFALEVLEEEKGLDASVIIPAIIFHDVGWSRMSLERKQNYRSKESRMQHMEEGAEIAKEVLADATIEYPEAKIRRIAELVRVHDYLSKSVNGKLTRPDELAVANIDFLWQVTPQGFDKSLRRREKGEGDAGGLLTEIANDAARRDVAKIPTVKKIFDRLFEERQRDHR